MDFHLGQEMKNQVLEVRKENFKIISDFNLPSSVPEFKSALGGSNERLDILEDQRRNGGPKKIFA